MKVGIPGATGSVGQRFVQMLENHPTFEVFDADDIVKKFALEGTIIGAAVVAMGREPEEEAEAESQPEEVITAHCSLAFGWLVKCGGCRK